MGPIRIAITGASGFVGVNLLPYLKDHIAAIKIVPIALRYGDPFFVKADTYIHLAGKAHDTSNTANSEVYYEANYLLTKTVYDRFLEDDTASCFVYMSSVKAVADSPGDVIVDEDYSGAVETAYGKSKRMAEEYIILNQRPDKRVYILRPCMIHGPGNKGNLNLLYKLVRKGIPYPLAAFNNKRSFLSVENLCFVICELIIRKEIESGIYHVCDDEPVSTKNLIQLMANSLGKSSRLMKVPKIIIKSVASIGDLIPLPLNTEKLKKLTDNYLVSNAKLKNALGKPLAVSAIEGLRRTIESFNHVA